MQIDDLSRDIPGLPVQDQITEIIYLFITLLIYYS